MSTKRRSGEAQAAQRRTSAGPMKHRLEPRGGARNEYAELIEDVDTEPVANMPKLYTYNPVSGVTSHSVTRRNDSYVVQHSIAGEVVRESEVDKADSRYHTMAKKAIQAFISRGEARVLVCDPKDRADWYEALEDARKALKECK